MKYGIWEEITKEEYDKNAPREESLWDLIPGNYKKEAVYDYNSLFDSVWHPERKVIGYKYYKLIEYKNVLVCGSTLLDLLIKEKII